MITFKQYLSERVFNFEKREALRDKKIQIGIEFEYEDYAGGGENLPVEEYEDIISEFEDLINDVENAIEERENAREEILQGYLDDYINPTIEELNDRIDEIDTLISSKILDKEYNEETIISLKKEIENLDEEISGTDNEDLISELMQSISDIEIKITELEDENNDIDEEISELEIEKDEKDEEVYNLNSMRENDILDYMEREHNIYFIEDLDNATTLISIEDYPSLLSFNVEMRGNRKSSMNQEIIDLIYGEDNRNISFNTIDVPYEDEFTNTDGADLEIVYDKFKEYTGFSNVVIDTVNYTKWNITTDSSETSETAEMIEIISPVMSIVEIPEILKMMFNFIEDNGNTTKYSGMHVNISYKGFRMENIDVLKYILFLSEGWIYKILPDRKNYRMCQSMLDKLEKMIDWNWDEDQMKKIFDINAQQDFFILNPRDTKKILKEFEKFIPSSEKFNAINYSSINKGNESRLEIRWVGGREYHRKYKEVLDFISYFAHLLKVAMDPSYKRKEYIKKLYKLWLKNRPEIELTPRQKAIQDKIAKNLEE